MNLTNALFFKDLFYNSFARTQVLRLGLLYLCVQAAKSLSVFSSSKVPLIVSSFLKKVQVWKTDMQSIKLQFIRSKSNFGKVEIRA